MRWLMRLLRDRKGAVVAEYAVLLAGILVVSLAAVSIGGHKISDLWAVFAVVMPGAHAEDNGTLQSAKLVETTPGAVGTPIQLDTATIATNSGKTRLGNNLGFAAENLVVEPTAP